MRNTKILLFLLFALKIQGQQIYVANTLIQSPAVSFIYSLDLSTCEVSNVVSSNAFADIALTPDGQLYGTAVSNWFRINPMTGVYTILPQAESFMSGNCMVALDNNTLLFSTSGNLYGYHISDGSIVNLGIIGHSSSGDLAWIDNTLYLTEDQYWLDATNTLINTTNLIKIVLNADNTAIQSVTQIFDPNNPLPGPMYALTSVSVENYTNMLIGAVKNKIYKICPYDASYELLCEMNPQIISGMASSRLPIQNPQPITCGNLSLPDITNNDLILSPNPIAKDGVLHIKTPVFGNSSVNARIINMQGVILYNGFGQADSFQIDLKNLNFSSGIYLVEITKDTKTKVQKLIIE